GRTVTATPSTGTAITTTTTADGTYTLTGLTPGVQYTISVDHSGDTCSTPTSGDCTYTETLTSGQSTTGDDFGLYQKGTVAGTLFEDMNGDGSKASSDPGRSGWTVYVDYNGNGIKDSGEPSATTGPDGSYTIADVNPGTYS